MIYSLVAHVDFEIAFKAVVAPGLLVIAMFAAYCVYVGVKEKIPRKPFDLKEVAASGWELKWELGIPVILVVGLKKAGLAIDECAGAVALYADFDRVLRLQRSVVQKRHSAASRKERDGGARRARDHVLILSMANALINYVVQEKIPDQILNYMIHLGIDTPYEFLPIAMNIFPSRDRNAHGKGFPRSLVAGAASDPSVRGAFSSPGRFTTAMIFLVNLELAYCCPPLGLNLFISSFRFNRPAVSLYRPILPFLGVLLASLLVISYVPKISTIMITKEISAARAKAAKLNAPPSDAWKLECVQDDPNNPMPCTEEERKKYPQGQSTVIDNPIAVTGDAGVETTTGDGGDVICSTRCFGFGRNRRGEWRRARRARTISSTN